ncbi:MAG: phasin family protein [Pseudomonadota bacterium]
MFPYSEAITPSASKHLQAQLSFVNDLSRSMLTSFQRVGELNLQLAHTLVEESSATAADMLAARKPIELVSACAAHAQPAAGKLQAYQQHLSRVAAETQVALSKVAEEHIPETSRTAKTLADDVARAVSEHTDKAIAVQQEASRRYTDPFTSFSGAMQRQWSGSEMGGTSTMQSADEHGNSQGGIASAAQTAQQGGARSGSSAGAARK